MIEIVRPTHKYYALARVSNETYINTVNAYSFAKDKGIKATWAVIAGTGCVGVVKEIMKGQLVSYGKRKLGAALLGAMAYLSCPIVPWVTNSSKLIKFANLTHSTIACAFETIEDISSAAYFLIDMAFCGQPIKAGHAGRYSLMGNALGEF